MQKFKLFVGKSQKIPDGVKYYYYSASSQYILLYTAAEAVRGFLLVDENQVRLAPEEREWLFSCKVAENKKSLQEHEAAYREMLETYISFLENEVKTLKAGEMKNESRNARS